MTHMGDIFTKRGNVGLRTKRIETTVYFNTALTFDQFCVKFDRAL